MNTQAAVEIAHLRKAYGEVVAVNDVSFSVEAGEIFGILGPNGAGKTTTVECVLGLRSPDAGSIRVLGLDPGQDREDLHQIVGAQLQESALPGKLRVGEILDLYRSFYRRAGRRRGVHRHARSGREAQGLLPLPVGRPAPAAVHRAGPHRPAEDRRARRDDGRARSAGPAGHLGPHRGRAGPRGDDPPGDALHGGSRAAVRPGGPHRRRTCRRARQPGRPGRPGQRRDQRALRPLGLLRRPPAERASRGAHGHPKRLPRRRHRDRRAGQRGDPHPGCGGRDRP